MLSAGWVKWGKAVQITEVRILDDDDLVERLTDMRKWLDNHRFNPSTFTYFFLDPGMKIHVAFKVTEEAEAFAQEFRGILVDTPPATSVTLRERRPGGPFSSNLTRS